VQFPDRLGLGKMEIEPYILFLGKSVDASIQVDLLKEYILHMEDSLAEKIGACEDNQELPDSLLCIAEDKSGLLSIHFPRLLQTGFVISVIILFENELTSFCQDLQRVEIVGLSQRDLSGSFIERFKRYCEHVAKIDLSISSKTWEKVRSVMEMRNCLVHNAGSLVNFGKSEIIKSFSKRHGWPKIEDNFIVMDKEVSLKLLQITSNFIDSMYDAALSKYPKKKKR
jgi:hypothetical protein